MKIIFLDIDGVLNNEQIFIDVHNYYEETGKHKLEIDEIMVNRLKQIVYKTGAKIVLSSSWRYGWNLIEDGNCIPYEDCKHDVQLNEIFNKYGLSVYSRTLVIPREDDKYHSWRENEIKDWLDRHNDVESFVILDDETFDLMKYVEQGKVVKTSNTKICEMIKDMKQCDGLQEEHVELAIEILNRIGD